MMESLVPEHHLADYTRERTGPILPNVAPSNVYPTADGRMILIAANQDTVFRRLAGVMGRPDFGDDARFATHSARGENLVELDDLISAWSSTISQLQLLELLESAAVPAGLIYTAADMLADPHFQARDSIIRVAHPEFDEIAMQNVVPRLSETPGAIRWAGPELGEHNDEVYGEVLGLTESEIGELAEQGVI
jgi:formyl-CoA transferase